MTERSIGARLYRGELGFDFMGRRKTWYAASAVILTVCLLSMIFRGFNFGIEFEGGNSFQFPGSEQQLEQAQDAAASTGVEVATAQVVGQDSIMLRTAELDNETAAEVTGAIAQALGLEATTVSNSTVSARWGGDITNRALQALVVFLIAVVIFIAIRFQPKMAVAALAALLNDLIVAAGVYSLVGFEVTPSTVIGLLTILGFSLYDTVVVFDKVDENTRGIVGGSRTTYSEAANLAVNQTLMRSINTSLIALLPVAGLLFVGAGLLGAGTLKDLALVLFVGLATGAYSSIFLASPILCDLKEREPAYAALRKRVEARRSSGRGTDAEAGGPAKASRRSRKGSRRPAGGGGGRAGAAGKAGTVAKAGNRPTAKKAPAGQARPAKSAGGTVTAVADDDEVGSEGLTDAEEADASTAVRPAARRTRAATPTATQAGSADRRADDQAGRTGTEESVRDADPDSGLDDSDTDTDPDVGGLDDADPDVGLDDADSAGGVTAAEPEPVGTSTPAGRPAPGPKPGQRGRSARPAGKSTSRRGGRPSGKRKR